MFTGLFGAWAPRSQRSVSEVISLCLVFCVCRCYQHSIHSVYTVYELVISFHGLSVGLEDLL